MATQYQLQFSSQSSHCNCGGGSGSDQSIHLAASLELQQSLYEATLFLSQRNTTFIGNCFWPKTAEEPKNETNTHALRLAEWLA